MDGSAKIFKENKIVQNRPSLAEMAVTEFRVRCFNRDAAMKLPLHVLLPPAIKSTLSGLFRS